MLIPILSGVSAVARRAKSAAAAAGRHPLEHCPTPHVIASPFCRHARFVAGIDVLFSGTVRGHGPEHARP